MDDQTFHTKLAELMGRLKDLPEVDRTRLEELAETTRMRREKIQTSVSELQESLDYLRLSVKYLVFDLEATRRENTYLRKLVEQANKEDNRKRRRSQDDFLDQDGDNGV